MTVAPMEAAGLKTFQAIEDRFYQAMFGNDVSASPNALPMTGCWLADCASAGDDEIRRTGQGAVMI